MTNYCYSCEFFWVTTKNDEYHRGRCHRYPPQIVNNIAGTECPWTWPLVAANGSCGEWKLREHDGPKPIS